jgi:4'-phosphopantetheinyl transferase
VDPADMMFETLWNKIPAKLHLTSEEVHVWCVIVNHFFSQIDLFAEVLDKDEKKKADSFYFQRDRIQYITSHTILRKILAGYLHTDPSKIMYQKNEYGKPALENSEEVQLEFNMAHSKDLALFAFALDKKVGIDIEYVNPEFTAFDIAERFFTQHENKELFGLPLEFRRRGFFNCWTRKEAFIKATGLGLSTPLNSFHVSLIPGEPAFLFHNDSARTQITEWSLKEIKLNRNYTGALCTLGAGYAIRYHRLTVATSE